MAEALAVVGVVASIVQLVDFSSKVLRRLEEFQSSLGEIPRTFRHISAELPVLQSTLQQTKDAIDSGSVGYETKKVLLPVIKGCTQQIESLDVILSEVLPTVDDSRLRRGKKAVLSLRLDAKVESITKILRSYIGTLTFYHAATSSLSRPLTDTTLAEIRRWLSPPDPSMNYQKALKQRQADTGLWFLNSDEYIKWKTDPASIIWLHGIPGSGKTILSSTVLQDVFRHCADDPGKVVIYFYFDFNDTNKQAPELMVRSLIWQLSRKCVKSPTSIEALFSACDDGERQPPMESLLSTLQEMIQEFPQLFIVLDALDECLDRVKLMDVLEQVAGWQLENLHLIVTSRKERDIESSLEIFIEEQNIICLQSKLVDGDIKSYVHQRLSVDKGLRKWQKDTAISHEIEVTLMKGAHGMFRWAVCQMDALAKCLTRGMLRKALADLPPTLDSTYEQILCSIVTEHSDYAIRILNWLAFSCRPLTLAEISEVVAIDIDRDPMFDREDVLQDPLDVLTICSSLITIAAIDDNEDSTYPEHLEDVGDSEDPEKLPQSTPTLGHEPTSYIVALAHYSVKEYLVSERSRKGRAQKYSLQDASGNEFIAKSCLGYLLQFQGYDSVSLSDIEESELAGYATKLWFIHAQAAQERGETLNRQILEFFSTGEGAYLNWVRIHDPDTPWDSLNFTKSLEDAPTPFYFVCRFNLSKLIEPLLCTGVNINAAGGREYGTALQVASAKGHDKVVERLLSAGANVNSAYGGQHGNALQVASAGGHDKIVEQLLNADAYINAQSWGDNGNALQAASANGHGKIVERLLSAGADINAQGRGEYGTALQAASGEGYDEIVERLLSAGADIDAPWENCGTALQAASAKGHDEIVERLLSAGADVNAEGGGYYDNALQAASGGGYDEIVERLLSAGADINAQGKYGNYGTALQAASLGGHDEVVERLLSAGADVNAPGTCYGTALQVASGAGHDEIVERLLSADANVNAPGEGHGDALQAASREGYDKIVELLLSAGADVNAEDSGYYSTALEAASGEGHDMIVERLLEAGAIRKE